MLPKRAVLLCILVFVLAAPAAAGSIERIVTPSGNGLDITLTLTDIPVGGIVETLPDGCTWTEADHPENRTRVSGQQVAFAVIGEEAINYRARGPQDAAEAFTGTWEDLLTGESGTVGAGGARDPIPGATAREAPGFLPAAALAALAVAYRWRCGR
jgi:hypothetical protein